MSGQATPPLPEYMPPLELFLPWVVQACQLPQEFKKGRETAYRLLCELTITHWHTSPHPSHLPHFYHLMHLALQPDSVSKHQSIPEYCINSIFSPVLSLPFPFLPYFTLLPPSLPPRICVLWLCVMAASCLPMNFLAHLYSCWTVWQQLSIFWLLQTLRPLTMRPFTCWALSSSCLICTQPILCPPQNLWLGVAIRGSLENLTKGT